MRENTRCEVDEPMSTPTESTHNSSSSPNVRPVEEKKMRPPWASSVMRSSRRHSGAPRSGEPGIHIPGDRDYGFRAPRFARPRNDGRAMTDESQGGRIFFSNTGRTFGEEDELCVLSVGVDIGSSDRKSVG